MRIDDLNRTPLTQGSDKADSVGQKRAEDRKGTTACGADQADLSTLAQALATRDPARLEQLRLDVQSGKYDVSAEDLARAIINSHLRD